MAAYFLFPAPSCADRAGPVVLRRPGLARLCRAGRALRGRSLSGRLERVVVLLRRRSECTHAHSPQPQGRNCCCRTGEGAVAEAGPFVHILRRTGAVPEWRFVLNGPRRRGQRRRILWLPRALPEPAPEALLRMLLLSGLLPSSHPSPPPPPGCREWPYCLPRLPLPRRAHDSRHPLLSGYRNAAARLFAPLLRFLPSSVCLNTKAFNDPLSEKGCRRNLWSGLFGSLP